MKRKYKETREGLMDVIRAAIEEMGENVQVRLFPAEDKNSINAFVLRGIVDDGTDGGLVGFRVVIETGDTTQDKAIELVKEIEDERSQRAALFPAGE